ncbi:hypothetical protein AB0M79_14780, partial [Polymorphospora sp. NPDC051019]
MRFQALGPLTIQLEHGRLDLAGSREQRTLAALLLDTNRVVPVSRLVEAIWDERPPATSVKAVRNCVSALPGFRSWWSHGGIDHALEQVRALVPRSRSCYY